MKKLLALLVVAGFVVSTVVGCGGDTPKKDAPKTTTPASGDKAGEKK